VNVTLVPEQIVLSASFDAIVTLAGWFALTVVVMLFDVAGDPVKHGVAFDVITTVTASPFANAVVVYVALFVPTLAPFNFHW
jgi:hypothetical protein